MYEHHENEPSRPSHVGRVRQWLTAVAAVVFVLSSLAGVALWRQQEVRLLSVQTGSMAPALRPGDAVAVRQVETADLKPGDVISFRSPADPGVVITHRIVRVGSADGIITIITKGDSNASADQPLKPSLVIGRVERSLPNAGYLIDFIHSPAGLIAGVYLPAAFLVFGELRRLTAYYRPAYRHPIRA